MGMAIDKRIQGLLEDLIVRYIDGTLDRLSALGLEASMRLEPSVARLIADRTDEQASMSDSPLNFRRRIKDQREAGLAPGQSQSVDFT